LTQELLEGREYVLEFSFFVSLCMPYYQLLDAGHWSRRLFDSTSKAIPIKSAAASFCTVSVCREEGVSTRAKPHCKWKEEIQKSALTLLQFFLP